MSNCILQFKKKYEKPFLQLKVTHLKSPRTINLLATHGRIYKTETRQMEYNASMSQGKPKLASHLQKLEEK